MQSALTGVRVREQIEGEEVSEGSTSSVVEQGSKEEVLDQVPVDRVISKLDGLGELVDTCTINHLMLHGLALNFLGAGLWLLMAVRARALLLHSILYIKLL